MSSNAPDILSCAISNTLETIDATKSVHYQTENFNKLSSYLQKTAHILQELTKLNSNDPATLQTSQTAIIALTKHVTEAKSLAIECTTRHKIYLLLNSHKIITILDQNTKHLSGTLILLAPLFSNNRVINQEIINLSNMMMNTNYQTTPIEDEINEKIQLGIRERHVDRSFTNNLLISIANAIGVSPEQSALRTEYESFKHEMEKTELTINSPECLQIEQIIRLLGKADVISTIEEREQKYLSKRNSLGRQPLEPLQSFFCPITGDVMSDPVETPMGYSFERGAIERWLTEDDRCPVTKTPLESSALRTNKTLRQSIEEWRDRNTMVVIGAMKMKIDGGEEDEDEVIVCLGKLQVLMMERDVHIEWVMMEEYLPVFVKLVRRKSVRIRSLVLGILKVLADNHDGRKESIAKTDDAIKLIVCSLARKIEESKLALQLLIELSDNDLARTMIGNTQGCILLLVTISSSDDPQAANDAKQLLDNLSFVNQNIVQMAKANYFGPLLHLLASGSESVQRLMVETLSELEMTDHGKLMVCENTTVELLITMLSHDDIDMKKAAILALEKISSVPQNGLKMIKQNATAILLGILYREGLSIPSLVEKIAATVMNLAVSLTSQENEHEIMLLESEEDVFKLFSLISLNGPNVQQNVLRTFLAVCQSPSGLNIRKTLRKISSVQVLVQLCEHENQTVRSNSVKLFCTLTKDGDDEAFMEHVGPKCIETLLKIINTTDNVEEGVAAMEIISNLPKNPKMTQWILEAGALRVIISILSNHFHKPEIMIESASGALCRFTISSNQELQKKVAETGIIPVIVNLLYSGSALTKKNAAVSLRQFSESSNSLSRPVERKPNFLTCCLVSPDMGCMVHSGICTTDSSFCLLEANAIRPLVKVLDEPDFGACEAALDALLTLVTGEQLQKGSKVLEGGGAVAKMVKLLSSPSVRLQEKALVALERIFRLPEYKQKYKASAQMPLVDITQRGSSGMKSVAAKILAHLNVLHEQSSFF